MRRMRGRSPVDVRLRRVIGPRELVVALAQLGDLLGVDGTGAVFGGDLQAALFAAVSGVEDRLGERYYVAGLGLWCDTRDILIGNAEEHGLRLVSLMVQWPEMVGEWRPMGAGDYPQAAILFLQTVEVHRDLSMCHRHPRLGLVGRQTAVPRSVAPVDRATRVHQEEVGAHDRLRNVEYPVVVDPVGQSRMPLKKSPHAESRVACEGVATTLLVDELDGCLAQHFDLVRSKQLA